MRTTLSEEMLRYAAQVLREQPDLSAGPAIPIDAEELILAALRTF